jgi:hypothetical protein
MTPRLPLLLSAVLLASGCSVTTQLGAECVLVRKATQQEQDATGRKSVSIKESELIEGQDYVSFGALDCDELELTCVRDANHPRDTEPGSAAAATTDARGYCSQACVANSSICEVLSDDVAAGVRGRPMTCRSLALDQASLDALKRSDPVTYRQTFGENSSASFCAVALSADEEP